ncbi:S-layer homology domain-containing protein [Peribacillus loiseleuriae]|uniref:S-layer homology domain-containing protein n=1 Tax=Peribacillus loiseleuriae TaxID=1679170 RepID=UPI003D092F73
MAYQPKSYRKFMAASLSVAMVATAVSPALAAETKSFPDVPATDAHAANIAKAVELGLIKGKEDGTFAPYTDITRGQVAKILARHIDADFNKKEALTDVTPFTDVPSTISDSELYKASLVVKKAGVFTGSNGALNAANPISRQQMAKVLVNAFDLKDNGKEVAITDLDKATEEMRPLIKILAQNGVTNVTAFDPTGAVQRGQFATFMVRAIDLTPVVVAPEVTGVSAINAKQALVTFKGALPTGVDFTNFELSGGLTVADVKISSDRKSATITASSEFTRNQEYTVSVFGVKDAEGKEYAETKGKFTWEVAEGVTVALEATTLEQGQTVGLTVKDAAGKDVKDAVVAVTSYNENLVAITNGSGSPSEVEVTANNAKLAGSTDVVVETTLPDGSVLTNTFQVTVKEAVTTVSSAGYSLEDDLATLTPELANTVAFKSYADAKTSVVEGSGSFELAAFGETNGNPDTAHINFTGATRVVSSNPIVATAVLTDGAGTGVITVTPLSAGSTTVTVTMKDGSRKTFPITVTAEPVQKSIGLDATTVKLSDETRKGDATNEEGVDKHTFNVESLDQFNKEIAFSAGKVTVSSSTEGLELYHGATQLVAGNNEVVFAGGTSTNEDVTIVAKKDTPVSNAKVTVSYFAKATDAKPTVTKTITVNVADIDPEALTSSIDVKAASEIDANYEVSEGKSSIDFSDVPVYALDSKGNRLELLTATATIADKDADDKFVAVTSDEIAFKDVNNALTYLRASNTVNVVVSADNVTKVLPITYKNTAIVPNKATVATSALSIKLTGTDSNITINDIIFGKADGSQLIKDDLVTAGTADEVVGILKTAKNAGYKYNKPVVSITGTDGKALATGVNVYGGTVTGLDANSFNNAIVEALKGYSTTSFAADDFDVDYMVANVNDAATISSGTVTPATGKATTFTLVIKGIYTTGSVAAIEGATPTTAEQAAHNLLAAPVQLNVSVTK